MNEDLGDYAALIPKPAQPAADLGDYGALVPKFQPVAAPKPALVAERDPRLPQQREIDAIAETDPGFAEYLNANPGQVAPSPLLQAVAFNSENDVPLDTSALGAAWRGLKTSIVPAIAGTISAAAGSVFGGLGAIPAGVAGGMGAAKLQDSISPPTRRDILQAQADEENNKAARIIGEFLPALATMRPSVSGITKAVAGDKAALRGVALGTTLGAGIPAGMSLASGQPLDPARIAAGAVTGAAMTPNKLGSYLFDKNARTQAAGQKAAERTMEGSVTNAPAAIANLENAGQLNQGGVKLLSGDVSGDPGLSRLQRAVTNRMDPKAELFAQDQANAQAIGGNIAEATAPVASPPPSPEAAGKFLTGRLDAMRERTAAKADAKRAEFSSDAQARLAVEQADADKQIAQKVADGSAKISSVEAEALRLKAEKSAEIQNRIAAAERDVAAAQEAAEAARAELAAEQAPIADMEPTTVKAAASESVKNSLLEADEAAKKPIRLAYNKAEVDPSIPADFTNTYAAAKQAIDEAGDTGTVPAIVRRIVAVRKPKSESPTPVPEGLPIVGDVSEPAIPPGAPTPFKELRADLRNVNDELRGAMADPSRASEVRWLNKVKDGINADLNKIGEKVPELKAANAAYRAYAERFKQGAAGDVLRGGKQGAPSAVPPSETLDRVLRTSEGAKQLADNVGGDPAAVKAVRDWYVSDLAATTKGKPTAEAVNRWLNRNADTLQHFPEIRKEVGQMSNRLANKSKKIGDMEREIADRELTAKRVSQVLRTEESILSSELKAKQKQAERTNADELNQLKSRMSDNFKGAEREIKVLQRDLEDGLSRKSKKVESYISDSPASKFREAAPSEAISRIMEGGNPAKDMARLLRQSGRDKSGTAQESLKNGVREWFNSQVRNTGKVNGNDNTPDPVQPDELRASLDKMNKVLKAGSETRKAVEQVFTPEEMRSLDLARKQIEAMSRKIGSPSGGSDTEFGRGSGDLAEGQVNGLNVVERALKIGAGTPSERGPVTQEVLNLFGFIRKTWSGDFKAAAGRILVDAMKDPDKAAVLLRPVTKKTAPQVNELLRFYVPGRSPKDEETPEERSAKLRAKFAQK